MSFFFDHIWGITLGVLCFIPSIIFVLFIFLCVGLKELEDE